jgi:O-methyltransferase
VSRYLDLLRDTLTRVLWMDHPYQRKIREIGRDYPWPKGDTAETMIGCVRLDNIRKTIIWALSDHVPGDLAECGVWRGGAAIFMRAVLAECEERAPDLTEGRAVWVCDSFQGCPPPDPTKYPVDAGDPHSTFEYLAVMQNEVKANFRRYGLLDENVKFLPGWFKDTLPGPIEKLAVLRIDGDLYESTIQVLEALYPKVSPGGFVIVDDYQNILGTQRAVDDYRTREGITAEIHPVDWCAVWWRKPE